MTAAHGLILLALLGLLACAVVEDVRRWRLPNRLTAGVALLYPLHVLLSPTAVAWLPALALAAALFAAGTALFAWRVLGGGDVKLIAALGLWAGLEHFAAFAVATTLSGGVLALFYLWYRRSGWYVLGPLRTVLLPKRSAETAPPTPAAVADESASEAPSGVPYGVAITVGGLVVIYRILGL